MIGVVAARTYVPYQDLESKAMLLGFLENPGNFIDHLRRYAASLTTQMTFGFRTTSIEDSRFKEAFDVGMTKHFWHNMVTHCATRYSIGALKSSDLV